jgi:hypothetical protein
VFEVLFLRLMGYFSWVVSGAAVVISVALFSNNIRMGGLISSSYWPVFTLHKKQHKNMAATLILANNKMMMTLIVKI